MTYAATPVGAILMTFGWSAISPGCVRILWVHFAIKSIKKDLPTPPPPRKMSNDIEKIIFQENIIPTMG